MKRIEKAIFTNMCMVYDNSGRILVQDRKDPDWPGVTFPGGHVEIGESFTDSTIREVYEETGLKVSNLQLCGIKDWTNDDGTRYIVLCYKTSDFEGDLISSDEGEMFWIPLSRISELKLADGMENMLKLFINERISEQFFYQENKNWIEVLK